MGVVVVFAARHGAAGLGKAWLKGCPFGGGLFLFLRPENVQLV
jgi:hypothetical protein